MDDSTTGLTADDVFYFGSAIGESGNKPTDAYVDATDFAGVRDHTHNFLDPAAIDDAYDYNRDTFVDGADMVIARDNTTNFVSALQLISIADSAAEPQTTDALGALSMILAESDAPAVPR